MVRAGTETGREAPVAGRAGHRPTVSLWSFCPAAILACVLFCHSFRSTVCSSLQYVLFYYLFFSAVRSVLLFVLFRTLRYFSVLACSRVPCCVQLYSIPSIPLSSGQASRCQASRFKPRPIPSSPVPSHSVPSRPVPSHSVPSRPVPIRSSRRCWSQQTGGYSRVPERTAARHRPKPPLATQQANSVTKTATTG